MKTEMTVNIDDELLEKARQITKIKGKSDLVEEGITALMASEASRQLADMGGTQPHLKYFIRRRPDPVCISLISIRRYMMIWHWRRRMAKASK